MAREYFCAYHSLLESIEPLGDAERGRLFTACLEYSKTDVVPELHGNERFIFPTIKAQIDRDNAKYAEKTATNSDNGKKGAEKRWRTPETDSENSERYRPIANYSENSQDKGKDKGKDKDKDKDKDKGKEERENDAHEEASADASTPSPSQSPPVDNSKSSHTPEQTPKKSKKAKKSEELTREECLYFLENDSTYEFSAELRDSVKNWVEYKYQRNQPYVPIGFKSQLTEIDHKRQKYGELAIIALINLCISNGWKGIIWEKLTESPAKNTGPPPNAVQKASSFDLEEFFNKAAAKSMKYGGDTTE